MAPEALISHSGNDIITQLTQYSGKENLLKTASSLTKSAHLTNSITTTSPPELVIKALPLIDAPLAELDASSIQCTYSSAPRPVPALDSAEMASQKICTDHMIQARWTVDQGWDAPTLQPYGPLSLAPTASCLHYATECFEGMKLYRGFDGKLRLFRPNLNCNRMLMSSNRIALPAFEPNELLKLVVKLCVTDGKKWLPKDRPGSFLYIRPTMIATDSALGVERPKEALLYVILCCFAPMGNIDGGIKLLASQDDMCRAWPGGFGYAKVGANYGPSLAAQGEARKRGFHQILWLFGDDCTVTEAGASNFFVVWRTRTGKLQLVTADLTEGTVLDGVTRRSILELACSRLVSSSSPSDLEALEILERKFSIFDIVRAAREGRLVEAFASGTAWFIAPINLIHFRGEDIEVPTSAGQSGAYARVLRSWMKGIMWGENGEETNEWGYVVDEE